MDLDFAEWAEQKGFTPANLSDGQRATLRVAWRAEQNAEAGAGGGNGSGNEMLAEPPAPELDEMLGRQRAEQARQRRITAMIGEAVEEHPGRIDELEQIGRSAIRGKWSEQQTELAVLRACRASAPLPLGRSGAPPPIDRVLEAAFCQATGLAAVEKVFDERTLEAAHRQFKGGLGVQQFLLLAAQQNGYRSSVPVKANLREVMQFAFTPRASGVSLINVPGILSNVANKFIREAFLNVERVWPAISARRSLSDFKAVSTYSLSGDLIYEELPPGGQIKHGTLAETVYTQQLKTYAKMLGLDRRDLINDDAGAFAALTRMIGRGGAIKLNKVFWGVFLNNSSFFTAGNNNVTVGPTSALTPDAAGLAAIDAANAKFLLQTDPDGNLMGARAAIILAPPAKAAVARQLMSSTSLTGGSTATPVDNPWAGMFRVESSAYMQDSTLTGNSATAWYLLAEPTDVPVIEVGFLNGNEMPSVETAEADFNQLGIQIRGYHDFSAALQEFRGGVRNAGA
jgi:hypothetical protein